jgi:hypothetical protein
LTVDWDLAFKRLENDMEQLAIERAQAKAKG